MSVKLHFAVLAHAHEPLVAALVDSLRETYPTCGVSLFNGGRDPGFFAGTTVEVNPYSRPVRYGNMMPFHIGTLRWLVERSHPWDYLVTLDHDVMVVRPGFDDALERSVGLGGFTAARLREARHGEAWELGGTTVPYIHGHWRRSWQPLLGLTEPWWAFNPVQGFGRDVVEAMWAHPSRARITDRSLASRIWAIEEVVMPSWALASGGTPVPLAGEEAIEWHNVPLNSVGDFFADPEVFFAHRVPMHAHAPERLAIEGMRREGAVPALVASAAPTPEPVPHLAPRWSPGRWRHALDRRATHLRARYVG